MYRRKDSKLSLIYNLHPATVLTYVATLFIIAMTYTHPLYLLSLFLSVVICLLSTKAYTQWKAYLLMGLFMTAAIVIINALFSPYGKTVLFRIPAFLIFGQAKITLEAVFYGVIMALKIILGLNIFCLYNIIADSDRVLNMFSKIAPKSAITAIMTTLMVPKMKRDLERVALVMSTRGAKLHSNSPVERIRSSYPLWKVLLLSSLEGSWDTAEAMNSKGFGAGKRTYYSIDTWKKRDSIIISFCAISIFVFALSLVSKKGFYNFYPTLEPIQHKENIIFVFCLFLSFLSLPVLDWGWKRWKFLRSRI